jgi:hypothetical protein
MDRSFHWSISSIFGTRVIRWSTLRFGSNFMHLLDHWSTLRFGSNLMHLLDHWSTLRFGSNLMHLLDHHGDVALVRILGCSDDLVYSLELRRGENIVCQRWGDS